MAKQFEASFDSLRTYTAPEWFRDAKFGIWAHWGPQSVPMYGDWYARNMYIQGTRQYEYHLRHYGHPSEFGYKDICALWKAEKFDPEALMEKYVRAGARYFVAQASHHDHFFNYDSAVNPMNSVNVGPHIDILAAWKKAAQKHGLPFGITEHLAASFSWWNVNKGCDKTGPWAGIPYDGNDPAYRAFYHDNAEHFDPDSQPWSVHPWHTQNKAYHAYWLKAVTEMIDKLEPDLLYSDGALPFGRCNEPDVKPPVTDEYAVGLAAVAHLYNKSIAKYGENHAVYLQKDRRPEIYKVGTLDIEKSQLPGIAEDPWHTDTCIGNWFYDVQNPYKSPEQIVEMLVDIVSKNGCMLLNILQRPDGTIDREAEYILDELAKWNAVCGDVLYASRPWKVFGEGDTRVVIKGFTEEKTPWNINDFRFVQKNGKVYAFALGAKGGETLALRSFADCRVKNVRLVGAGEVPWNFEFGLLSVKLPDNLPVKAANALEIELD